MSRPEGPLVMGDPLHLASVPLHPHNIFKYYSSMLSAVHSHFPLYTSFAQIIKSVGGDIFDPGANLFLP